LIISGFVDSFYAFDFNKPQANSRQSFFFNHNRHNEFNVNLAFIKANVETDKYRLNLAIQTGTYANDNYAAEPGVYQNILEANVGMAIDKNQFWWIDAGILPSHIGFESAISSENYTLTRSILAENSPYFLTGAKLSFQKDEKLALAFLLVNGWQNIQRTAGNSFPSFGTQLFVQLHQSLHFNWSTLVSTNDPDDARRIRYFTNLYSEWQLGTRLGLKIGTDIGLQQRLNNTGLDWWVTPIIIGQFRINNHWATALRVEYYHDPFEVMINTPLNAGFTTAGLSYNVDWSPSEMVVFRTEVRYLQSSDQVFIKEQQLIRDNLCLAGSIAIRFASKPIALSH
jgi:hypothetical protein